MRKEAALIVSFVKDMDFDQFSHDEKTKRAVTQTLANPELLAMLEDVENAEQNSADS